MKYIALLFLVSCGIYTNIVGPKFKVGDCVDSKDVEFVSDHPRKILAVGKTKYLYQYKDIQSEFEIYMIDYFNKKVDCKSVGY